MKIQNSLSFLLVTAFLLAGVLQVPAQQFSKVTTGAIVTTSSGSRSCNFLDVNNDGFQDILITNGKTGGQDNFLYLNNGDGTFTTSTGAVSQDGTPTDGASCADFNNDGWIDIYAVNWYNVNNLLYQNSSGSMVKIDTGIVPNNGGYSETASWGDYNQDGLVDLYVTNSAGTNRNYLYKNLGLGGFQKVNGIAPVNDGFLSRSANWIDYDLDGDQDLFVTNENNQANNLYRNDGGGVFVSLTGLPPVSDNRNTMSSSWADYDNDGDFDLFVANYEQANKLFKGNGIGGFSTANNPFGADIGCSWSSSFADYDNDGDLDLFVTNGYCSNNISNYLYENNGDGTFSKNLTEPVVTDVGGSYGCAWGDYDNDGFMDLVVANWQGETQSNNLYHNNGNANKWMELKLEGTVSNRAAIGAIVRCKATINGNVVWQMREVSAQTGYCSQNSLEVHFGMGDAATIDSVQVIWPSGIVQDFSNIATGKRYTLIENGSIAIVGIEDRTAPKYGLNVYPNPNSGKFTVEVKGLAGKSLKLELVDLKGRKVFRSDFTPSGESVQLPVADLIRERLHGIYFLSVSEDAGVLMREKVVVMR